MVWSCISAIMSYQMRSEFRIMVVRILSDVTRAEKGLRFMSNRCQLAFGCYLRLSLVLTLEILSCLWACCELH